MIHRGLTCLSTYPAFSVAIVMLFTPLQFNFCQSSVQMPISRTIENSFTKEVQIIDKALLKAIFMASLDSDRCAIASTMGPKFVFNVLYLFD